MFSRIMFTKRSRNNYKWTHFTVTVLYVITYRLKYFHRSSTELGAHSITGSGSN